MRKIILYAILLFTSFSFSQTKQEAADYINLFFNNSTTFVKASGGFKYIPFNNSINFSSTDVMFDPTTFETKAIMEQKFSTSISNIEDVRLEVVSGTLIVDIYFKKEVERFYSIKEKDALPTASLLNLRKINLSVSFNYSENEFIAFKKAMRILIE